MVESLSIVQGEMSAAAQILARGEGVSWAYELLEHVAAHHHLTDAWLVVHPTTAAGGSGGIGGTGGSGGTGGIGRAGGIGTQLFGLGGRAVPVDRARTLLTRPAGIYGEPENLDSTTSSILGAMCGGALRASLAAQHSAVDHASGLQSHFVISASAARAAACGARNGWSTTLVLLTTSGDAPAKDRWLGLAAALQKALRSGDEAGVTAPGTALAILANAGPDAVRPFVARVRAALSAAGWDEIDLHAAAARTPEESVDPAELRQLVAERLADIGAVGSQIPDAAPTFPGTASTFELELRRVPGVVSVEMSTPVVVVSSASSESLHDDVLRVVRTRLPGGSVRVLTVPDVRASDTMHTNGNGNGHTNGNQVTRPQDARGPHAISATAPANPAPTPKGGGDTRVLFLGAGFDARRGTSEVSLALGAARGTGRSAAGPLAGGAQATLNALEALAIDVPFYLVSAERAHGVPGEPVVVVLAPKRSADAEARRAVERLGVASGDQDVEAASRATLGALNRHLARTAVTP